MRRFPVLSGAVSRLGGIALALGIVAATLAVAPPADAAAAPTKLKVAAGGQYTTGLRLQWSWSKSATKYQLQTATSASFAGAKITSVARASKPLAGNSQAVSVKGLQTATYYYARVRSLTGSRPSAWSSTGKFATAVAWPSPISSVTAKAGPGVGQTTISWKSTGQYTTEYRIEAGQTIFSKTDKSLPKTPRDGKDFTVAGTKRSVTLKTADVAKAGAKLGSANHLYFRVFAVTKGNAGTHERAFANLRSTGVKAMASSAQMAIRVGSYNMRTAGAGDTKPFTWPERAPYAAKTIMSRKPGVIALQELSPGPSDGHSSPVRQTDSLINALKSAGGSYQLVRNTSYFAPGTPMGNTGMRIAYDTTRYQLMSDCPNQSGSGKSIRNVNQSCSFLIPLDPGDAETFHRSSSYALLKDKATGGQFWFVSVHLEHRQSDDAAESTKLEKLRGRQMQFTIDKLDKMNTEGYPIIIAGDLNTWQNQDGPDGYDAHSVLVDNGFWDSAAAASQVNLAYATVNNFATKMTPSTSGFGARLDVIAVKGAIGATRFENVMSPTDPKRASDHNMIVADLKIPKK